MGTDKHLRADHDLLKGKLYVNQSKEKPRHIPQIKWECPPKFIMDPSWHVAAGEESTEVVAQSRRQILLEAVYPCYSSIPSSPSRSFYVADYYDDSNTPLILSSPIKEGKEESFPTDTVPPFQTVASSKLGQPKDMFTFGNLNTPNFNPPESSKQPALEGDMMAVAAAGAAAALTAYAQSKDEGSLIDTDLLIHFLSNPETFAKSIIEHGAPANRSKPTSMLNEVTSSVSLPSSKLDQAMTSNIKEHGVPAKTGVHMSTFSGPKAMTPVSFPSTRPELEMMRWTDKHETSPRGATIPVTSLRPLLQATTNEHSAPASTGPSIAFPSSKAELQMVKLSDENVQSPSVATTPRSPLLSLDVKHKDEGSLIDTNLLMLFLHNPEIVPKLISELGASANTGSKTASMPNEVNSSFSLPSSKFDQVMKLSTNEHGVRSKIGVHISEPKAMTPVSFSSSKPELKMKFKNTHEPPPRVATIPITSLPPLTWATTHEHSASSSPGPSRYFSSFKPELDMIKLADENVQSSAVATNPRSPLLSLPRATAINEHSSPANTVVPTSVPKTTTPFTSFPSSNPVLGIMKLTDEHVSPPEVTMTPMSPLLSLPSATHNPILVKNLINDHRRHAYFESDQFTCSMLMAPLVPLPNPDPDVLKCKRLINEYGASDRTGIAPMPEKRLMAPSVPFSFPKKDISELPRGNQQPTADVLQSILHMRPLSKDVCPPPVIGGAASAPVPRTKLMTPSVPIPDPKTSTFILPMSNTQPTANVLQSALHAKPLTSAVVHSPPFVGSTPPPAMHGSYTTSEHGGMQGTLDYDLLSLLGILNNQLGGPELVQNMHSSASMPKHQNNQCGGPELVLNMNSSASMPKNQKPCMYFNGPRGCRNGSRCQYLHIMSDRPTPSGVKEPPPRAKRMKLDGETSGRM